MKTVWTVWCDAVALAQQNVGEPARNGIAACARNFERTCQDTGDAAGAAEAQNRRRIDCVIVLEITRLGGGCRLRIANGMGLAVQHNGIRARCERDG